MKDTWASRDLPVLEAAIELVDEMYSTGGFPEGGDIAARAQLDIESVGEALHALDGEYLELQPTGSPAAWGFRMSPRQRAAQPGSGRQQRASSNGSPPG